VTTTVVVILRGDAHRRWQPDVILFETNAAFAGIKDLLMRHASFGAKIEPVVQTRDKMSRVHAFSVPVENGSFRLRGLDPTHVHQNQQGLFDEMTSFPLESTTICSMPRRRGRRICSTGRSRGCGEGEVPKRTVGRRP